MMMIRNISKACSVPKKELQDLALSAFLIISGNPLLESPSKTNGKKLIFVFEATSKLEVDILSFYNRTAKVDPLTFSETFRNLKAMTF
jgi:hypothetical protein